jgi:hypothetical protein
VWLGYSSLRSQDNRVVNQEFVAQGQRYLLPLTLLLKKYIYKREIRKFPLLISDSRVPRLGDLGTS